MNETREELIALVTREVLAALEGRTAALAAPVGAPRMLVVGDREKVPAELARECALFTVEDYARDGNILAYDRLCITRLSCVELSDIALGRDSRPAQCAVIQALLHGKEVCLLEEGLPHRALAGKGSAALYGVLEGYVRTLQTFGVKLVGEPKPLKPPSEPKPPKFAPPPTPKPIATGKPNPQRLITEELAVKLAAAGGPVCLAANAILTPSARDVFTRAKVEIIREESV